MPKPTRYFGGLTELCVGEAHKIKYAAIANEFSDDDKDQELLDAEVVEENLLSICTCEGKCRGDCTNRATKTTIQQRPQRENRVNYVGGEGEEDKDVPRQPRPRPRQNTKK